MPWNSLLFALVGGFLFDTLWNRTKYNARRLHCLQVISQPSVPLIMRFTPSLIGPAFGNAGPGGAARRELLSDGGPESGG